MNISDMPATPFGMPMAAEPATKLPPLSQQRVAQALTRLGLNFAVDDDGDPISFWDTFLMRFVCTGAGQEVFQVRGMWAAQPPAEKRTELLEWCNAWHDEHRWPQVFLHVEDDRTVVFADLTVDLEFGVTNDQLDQQIRCAVGTCGPMYMALQEAYPEFMEWVPRPPQDEAAPETQE